MPLKHTHNEPQRGAGHLISHPLPGRCVKDASNDYKFQNCADMCAHLEVGGGGALGECAGSAACQIRL